MLLIVIYGILNGLSTVNFRKEALRKEGANNTYKCDPMLRSVEFKPSKVAIVFGPIGPNPRKVREAEAAAFAVMLLLLLSISLISFPEYVKLLRDLICDTRCTENQNRRQAVLHRFD